MSAARPVSLDLTSIQLGEDYDMGRRRLQQKGDLRKIGGFWRVRWHEDQIREDGSLVYGWSRFVDVGRCSGPGAMTKKQAEREAWDKFLSCLDQNMRVPHSVMTVAQFVERRFTPEHVMLMKKGGRTHYEAVLKYVLSGIPDKPFKRKGTKMVRDEGGKLHWPEEDCTRRLGIGHRRMRDVGHEDVQRLLSEAIKRGLSIQTAKHIKTCVSAIFTFAEEVRWFNGRNPAKFARLPEMTRRAVRVLSIEELRALLAILKPMARAMVLCASLTSMNIAEVCGLRWKRVNLSSEPVIMDGESLPGQHLGVREQWYLRQWGTVKAAARRRNLPLPSLLLESLAALRATSKFSAPDHPVFAGKSGRPIDQSAMLNKQVRRAAETIGVLKLGWHDLRRTFATLGDQMGMTPGEMKALMGHSRFGTTKGYMHTPSEAAIAALERLGEKVKGVVN